MSQALSGVSSGFGLIRFATMKGRASLFLVALTAGFLAWSGSEAAADCTPTANTTGPSNTTITCSGTVTNQNSPNGYGTGDQNNNTINVTAGTTVTGTTSGTNPGNGFFIGSGNTVNNSGTITGDVMAAGVNSVGNITVNNSGSITGAGDGVFAEFGSATVTNNASATINVTGGAVVGGNVTVTNSGTMSSNNNFGAIFANSSANITNNLNATITNSGAGGPAIAATGLTLMNAGTVQATGGGGGIAVFAVGATAGITNSGMIQATGTTTTLQSFGIDSVAAITSITNNKGATIQATSAALSVGIFSQAATSTTLMNAGTISGNEDGFNTNTLGTTTVTNSGTISGTGRSGIRVNSASITNNTGGLITGAVGIFSRTGGGSSVFNDGTITGTGGTAIQFSTGTVNNTLMLGTNSVINGNVLGAGSDKLQLEGASGTGTTNVSQYQGFSSFTKSGGSTWLLTGSAPTQNWSASAGVFGGTASIGGLSVQSGATFMPGNGSANTSMTLTGNLTFASNTDYLVNLTPGSASMANVTGTASLTGATVETVFAKGSYMVRSYDILHAAGGLGSTQFAGLTGLPPGFVAQLQYTGTDVMLDLTAALGTIGTSGLNGNQQNVATALNNFFNSGGALPPGFTTLFGLSGASLNNALTQASGETATGSQQNTFGAMTQFMDLLTDPFVAGRGDPLTSSGGANAYAANDTPRTANARDAYAAIYRKAPPADQFAQRWSVWAAGFGGSQTTDGNNVLGSNNTTSNIAGTAVGVDYRLSPFTLAGFALAGGGTSFSVANGGSGRSDLFQAGAFIRHTAGPAYISAALAYGWQDITTDRVVTVSGLDHLRAEFNANAFSGRAEGGYRFVQPWTGGIGITPYAAAQFVTFDLPAYAEQGVTGANTFALAYGAKDATDTRSELGIRTDKSFAMVDGIFTLRGRLAWAHDFNPDRSILSTFQALPGASFVVNGAAQASDSALVTASAEKKWLNGWSAAAAFEGEFSDVTRSYAGKGVLRYSW